MDSGFTGIQRKGGKKILTVNRKTGQEKVGFDIILDLQYR